MSLMPKPVIVSVQIPRSPEETYAFLDVMANHERFTDHLMTNWRFDGPDRGLGAKATVTVKAMGATDTVDFEVVEAEAPRRIVERNVARKAGRIGQGTYTLTPSAAGGTQVMFEYRWLKAPLIDRLTGPLARAYLRRVNATAMERLRQELAATAPMS